MNTDHNPNLSLGTIQDPDDAAKLALWPELVAALERMVRRDSLWGAGELCQTPAHEDAVAVLVKVNSVVK